MIPLGLLATRKSRGSRGTLFFGALLACGGVILNRTNVVVYALNLKDPIPQSDPQSYAPSCTSGASRSA